MAKQIINKFRKSASLIILSRNRSLTQCGSDYQVLLFNRPEKSSLLPNASVFPGGVCEPIDESPLWLKYFRKFGLNDEKLKELTTNGVCDGSIQRPSIFATQTQDSLQKDISLRITAIRETFEEVGILFCRDRDSLTQHNKNGCFLENFDRSHWQHKVHEDSTQFLQLCTELNVVPDLWSLQEWSVWLTPSFFTKRFQTAFYMVALEETPNLILEPHEATSFAWKTPLNYLKAFQSKELFLPPPQYYELSRLARVSQLEELKQFADDRARKGTVLMLPVQYSCTDGTVSLLPGDDMYPDDPYASTDRIPVAMTMREFRALAKERIHRLEYVKFNDAIVHLNFTPADGQLRPININLDSKF